MTPILPMLAALLLGAGGALACARGPGESPPGGPRPGDPASVPARPDSPDGMSGRQESGVVRTDSGLRVAVSLTEPPAADRPLEVRLAVTNETDEEIVLDFGNGQRYDFEIRSETGTVWRWAADMFFIQMFGRERIASGDTREWDARYEPGLPPGRYVVAGTLTATSPVVAELAFRIDG